MSNRLASWLQGSDKVREWRDPADARAAGVGNLIADKPARIELVRAGVVQAAQTVRIDVFGYSASERMGMGNNALINTQRVLVLGYRNHPTEADTDIQANDEFAYDGQYYRVVRVESGMTDRVEALAEATE